jgi:hypothetical protein
VAFIAVVLLGLSAGASLTEAVVLVPEWRALPAARFLQWFHANEPRLTAFFGPLQLAALVASVAAAWLAVVARRPGAMMAVVSAALIAAVIVMYFVHFRGTNARFFAGTVPADAVAGELSRWAAWHWVRTALGIGAFAAGLAAWRSRAADGRETEAT